MAETDPITKQEFHEELHRLRDTLDRWRVPIQAEQDRIKRTLYGNGEPGWDELLRKLIEWMNEQKKEKEDVVKTKRDTTVYLWRATIATALAAFVMLFINGVLYFGKLLPLLEKLSKQP